MATPANHSIQSLGSGYRVYNLQSHPTPSPLSQDSRLKHWYSLITYVGAAGYSELCHAAVAGARHGARLGGVDRQAVRHQPGAGDRRDRQLRRAARRPGGPARAAGVGGAGALPTCRPLPPTRMRHTVMRPAAQPIYCRFYAQRKGFCCLRYSATSQIRFLLEAANFICVRTCYA